MKIQPAKSFSSKMLTHNTEIGPLTRRLAGWSAWASHLAHRFELKRQRIFLQPMAMVFKRGEWRGRSPSSTWHFNLQFKWQPTFLWRHQFAVWQNSLLNNSQPGDEKIYHPQHHFIARQNNLPRQDLRLNTGQPRPEKIYYRLQQADPLGGFSSRQPGVALNREQRLHRLSGGGEQNRDLDPTPTVARGFRFLTPRLQAGVIVPLTIQRHGLTTTNPAIPLGGRSSRQQDTFFRGKRLETLPQPRHAKRLRPSLPPLGGLFGGIPVTEQWQRVEVRPGQFRAITPPPGGPGGMQNKLQLNEATPPVFRRPKIISEAQPSVGSQAHMPPTPSPPSLRGGDSGNGLVNGLPPPRQDLRQLDLNKLTDQVMQQIDRRMAIWRERTGRV